MLKVYIRIVVAMFVLTILGVPVWVTKLLLLAGVVIFIAKEIIKFIAVNSVKRAVLKEEVAVYKRVAEKTGFSVDWGSTRGRDHYKYVHVIDHYKCVFKVEYLDGKTGTIKCKKNDYSYNQLMTKV